MKSATLATLEEDYVTAARARACRMAASRRPTSSQRRAATGVTVAITAGSSWAAPSSSSDPRLPGIGCGCSSRSTNATNRDAGHRVILTVSSWSRISSRPLYAKLDQRIGRAGEKTMSVAIGATTLRGRMAGPLASAVDSGGSCRERAWNDRARRRRVLAILRTSSVLVPARTPST